MTALDAYSDRAQEYASALGRLDAMALQDVRRIESWGGGVDGPILDAGCGPGHWTAHQSALGHEACGVDPVPAFVQIARREHPGTEYRLGSFADLQEEHGAFGGILAWYSLIHLPPEEVPSVLALLHGALRPTGRFLLGFFDGARQESFDHAVATAQFWPAEQMVELLERAGFTIIDLERRQDPGARPHASISAVRR